MMLGQCVRYCLVLSVVAVSVRANNYSCPTWFYYNSSTQRCECGGFQAEWVLCDQETMTAQINRDFCVTFSGQDGLFYVSYCPLNYQFNNTNRMFSVLPTDPDQLEDMMCGPYNRKGLLCGECIDGYGHGVYTLDSKCADCSKFSTLSAICLYLLVDIIPITLFFICVIMFRLNITTGPLLGYVLFCQYFSVSLEYDPTVFSYIKSHLSPFCASGLQVMLIMFESWNANFLKSVIPPFCINEKITGMHIQIINSFSALYPVVLVTVSFFIIELHARNYRIIHIILKPFSFVLKRMNITTITSDSVMLAFATFLFLSSIKNMFVLYAMTRNMNIHSSIDGSLYKTVLYVDPTIEFLSPTHIMFLVIPLVQCIFLVFIPSLLLIIYPTKVYTKMSGFLSARKRLAITAFVESLNSCLKDGLNGTHDYRLLAGVIMLSFTLFNACVIIMEKTLDFEFSINILFFYSLLSLIVSFARVFKSSITNMSVSYYYIMFALANIVAYLWYNQLSISTVALEVAFAVIGTFAQVPVVAWALYKCACSALKKVFSSSSSKL